MTRNRKHNPKHEVVMKGVLKVIKKNNKNNRKWTGTMTELSLRLSKVLDPKQSLALPGSPSALRAVLNKVVNRLRCRGISVRFARTSDHARTRYVKFTE